jgi:ABC-type branched-subunit amino acid transport system substrate-binding protein
LSVLAAATSLLLAGCGRGDEGTGGDGGTKASPGVTSDPCPKAVDKDKGCIYLGLISDLTGPFAAVGVPLTAGGKAFWQQVNEDGGIGDYEVDVTTYVKDNQYNPEVHAQAFGEINGKVLAIGQSLGTAATEAMLKDGNADELVVLPATLGSNWLFEDRVTEIGTSYCAEAMNAVDYGVDELGSTAVAAIHFPGDYGDDAMVGARIAAEERDVPFTDIPTGPGADSQAAAIASLLKSKADLVMVSTSPVELAAIVGGAAAQGFKGTFIGSIPTWNAALLKTPAASALKSNYLWASSFPGWDADTAGHKKMRDAAKASKATPNEYFALGWSGGYVMKAVLEKAVADGDITRSGLLAAAKSLDGVDSEGMMPEGTGNYAGDANDAALRETRLLKPGEGSSSGAAVEVEPFTGPTAKGYTFKEACYLQK